MRKSRIIIAVLLALSVFAFTGCGDDGDTATDNQDNTTVEETTDQMEQDGDTVKDDVEDMGEEVKDGAEDMADDLDPDTPTDDTKANNQ